MGQLLSGGCWSGRQNRSSCAARLCRGQGTVQQAEQERQRCECAMACTGHNRPTYRQASPCHCKRPKPVLYILNAPLRPAKHCIHPCPAAPSVLHCRLLNIPACLPLLTCTCTRLPVETPRNHYTPLTCFTALSAASPPFKCCSGSTTSCGIPKRTHLLRGEVLRDGSA